MTTVRWWVRHEPARAPFPYALRCHLGGRTLMIPYATMRQAESMAPALVRALVEAHRP